MEDTQEVTRTKRRWPRSLLIGASLVAALAAVAGLALAAGGGAEVLAHRWGHGAHARDFVEFRIHRALRDVNATDAQEEQILAIVDGLFAKHAAHEAFRIEMHDRVAAALTAETVDRAALEAVRVEVLAHAGEGSKELVKAIGDIAEVLTPAQRRALAEKHRERFE
jgi:Spy/CpxP family protein refolding chaperone